MLLCAKSVGGNRSSIAKLELQTGLGWDPPGLGMWGEKSSRGAAGMGNGHLLLPVGRAEGRASSRAVFDVFPCTRLRKQHPDEGSAGRAGGRGRAFAFAALQMRTMRPRDLDFICGVIGLEVCDANDSTSSAQRSDVTHPRPGGGGCSPRWP